MISQSEQMALFLVRRRLLIYAALLMLAIALTRAYPQGTHEVRSAIDVPGVTEPHA